MYLKEAKYVTFGGYVWPEIKDKIYTTLGTTTYTSESDAMNACKNSDACKGISLVKKNTYKLGMLDDLKQGQTGVTSYIMGDELVTSASKYMIIPLFTIRIESRNYYSLKCLSSEFLLIFTL